MCQNQSCGTFRLFGLNSKLIFLSLNTMIYQLKCPLSAPLKASAKSLVCTDWEVNFPLNQHEIFLLSAQTVSWELSGWWLSQRWPRIMAWLCGGNGRFNLKPRGFSSAAPLSSTLDHINYSFSSSVQWHHTGWRNRKDETVSTSDQGVGVVNILGISGFHLTCLRGNIFPHQQSLDDSSDLVLGILSFQLMFGLVQWSWSQLLISLFMC